MTRPGNGQPITGPVMAGLVAGLAGACFITIVVLGSLTTSGTLSVAKTSKSCEAWPGSSWIVGGDRRRVRLDRRRRWPSTHITGSATRPFRWDGRRSDRSAGLRRIHQLSPDGVGGCPVSTRLAGGIAVAGRPSSSSSRQRGEGGAGDDGLWRRRLSPARAYRGYDWPSRRCRGGPVYRTHRRDRFLQH